MSEFEPKETGLLRTVWLFEREILEKLESTDLEDHHAVLKLNIFSMKYELKPKFNNGRADAIVMRDTANHWLKIWLLAFATCGCEKQSEIDQLKAEKAELEKTIQDALDKVFTCRVIGADRIHTCDVVEKALRGGHE